MNKTELTDLLELMEQHGLIETGCLDIIQAFVEGVSDIAECEEMTAYYIENGSLAGFSDEGLIND